MNTDGFKRFQIEFAEVLASRVLPVAQKDNSADPVVLKDTAQGPQQVELSNVDLGQEAVSQIIGSTRILSQSTHVEDDGCHTGQHSGHEVIISGMNRAHYY